MNSSDVEISVKRRTIKPKGAASERKSRRQSYEGTVADESIDVGSNSRYFTSLMLQKNGIIFQVHTSMYLHLTSC